MMKKSVAIILFAIVIISFGIAMTPVDSTSANKPKAINHLESLFAQSGDHLLQISLEECPACQMLDKEKAVSTADFSSLEIITVPISEKDSFRKAVKKLIPDFSYYPSIFLVRDGRVADEFDLSSLDNLGPRYDEWKTAVLP